MEIELFHAGPSLVARATGSQETGSQPHVWSPEETAALRQLGAQVREAALSGRPLGASLSAARALYASVFRDGVADLASRLKGASGREPLLLRFALDSPELQALPWEALCEPGTEMGFLASAPDLLPVRRVTTNVPWRQRRVDGAVKVLVIAPEGGATLQRIEDALRDRISSGEVELLQPITGVAASRDVLFPRLRKESPHILHFLGHGAVRGGVPSLRLADSGGERSWLPVELLSDQLAASFAEDLRLIVLEACEGAEPGAFASAAELLARGGADAVIAHLWPVSFEAARRCSHQLYDALAAPGPGRGDVARSLNDARRAMLLSFDGSAEAFSPVLYLRAPSARLFDLRGGAAMSEREDPAVIALRAALAALLGRLFATADLRRFLAASPGGEDLLSGLPADIHDKAEWTALAVRAMLRGGLVDDRLFERLLAERGYRRAEIEPVQAIHSALRGARAPGPVMRPPEVSVSLPPPVSPPPAPVMPGSWSNVTARSALGTALHLDRSMQWATVLDACHRAEHVFFLLHGHSKQSLGLFLDRIHHYLTSESGRPHAVYRVPFKREHSFATTGAEWEMHISFAIAPGRPGTAAEHLAAAARHKAVLLVLGLRPLHGLTRDQEQGVRELVCETLSRLLMAARPANPVRALMAVDFDAGEESLETKIDAWALDAERGGVLRYCALPEVKFPTWEEVHAYLRNLRPARPDAATIQRIKGEYDRLMASEATTFQQLAERLDRHLEDI